MFNKALLIGVVTDSPRLHTFPAGDRVINFTITTVEKWTSGKTGEKKERRENHHICVFNDRIIDFINQHIKEGSYCYVEGSLENKKLTNDAGQTKETVNIVLRPGRGQVTLMRGTEDLLEER